MKQISMKDLLEVGGQAINLRAGEELTLKSGVKDCQFVYIVIEGEIDKSVASELLRLRKLEQALGNAKL